MWLQAMRFLLLVWPSLTLGLGQQPVVNFEEREGSLLLADGSSSPTIVVDETDSPSVIRAAKDLAADFGRVTGVNGSVTNASASATTFSGSIVVGTVDSPLMQRMIESGSIDVAAIEDQWEAFTTVIVASPLPGLGQVMVIAGQSFSSITTEAHTIQEVIDEAQFTVFTMCRNRLACLPIISGPMCHHGPTNASSP